MIQTQLRYQLKMAISAVIPPKLPVNCSSVRQLQQQQRRLRAIRLELVGYIKYNTRMGPLFGGKAVSIIPLFEVFDFV